MLQSINLIGAGEGCYADCAEAKPAADIAQFVVPEGDGFLGHRDAGIARLRKDHDVWIAQPNPPAPRQIAKLCAWNTGFAYLGFCCLGCPRLKTNTVSKIAKIRERQAFNQSLPLARSSSRRA